MGCYLDPDNESKEAYLEREGREVESDYISNNYKDIKQKGSLPVVLVDNGNFLSTSGLQKTDASTKISLTVVVQFNIGEISIDRAKMVIKKRPMCAIFL